MSLIFPGTENSLKEKAYQTRDKGLFLLSIIKSSLIENEITVSLEMIRKQN